MDRYRAQISVTVVDINHKPIPSAIISLLDTDSSAILFSKTGDDGLALIPYDSTDFAEVKLLKISAPGYDVYYAPFTYPLMNSTVYMVAERMTMLKEVTIRTKKRLRLKLTGDTLSYAVRDFQHEGDRNLSDVLQRLPGLTVDIQGHISYNGKPVSNLYIEGDDILDGQYERATRNIRSDLVDTIQILEHDQPIRVLRGVVIPDKIAINISLKADATAQWFHQAKAGAGVNAYDAGWNALMVKTGYKSILSATSNKTGETNLVQPTLTSRDEEPIEALTSYLSAAPVSTPVLPFKYWLSNQNSSLSGNQLWKIKGNKQLRLIVGYDHEHQLRSSNESFFFPGRSDTVSFSQMGRGNIDIDFADINAAFIINTFKQYAEISLKTNFITNGSTTLWMMPSGNISSQLTNPVHSYQFDIIYLKQLAGTAYLQLKHQLRFQQSSEDLEVHPGVFKDILNNDSDFLSARQQFIQKPITITNAARWHQSLGAFRQAYSAGLNLYLQTTTSNLVTELEDGNFKVLDGPYKKDFSGIVYSPYLSGEWSRMGQYSELNFTASAVVQKTRSANDGSGPTQTTDDLLPKFSLLYRLRCGKENELRINSTSQSSTSPLSDLYNGTVLSDYRTLSSHGRPMQKQQFQNFSARYTFRKSVHIFSAYTGLSWEHQNLRNLDSSTIGTSRTIQHTSFLDYQVSVWRLSSGASKYFFPLKTTVSIRAKVSTFASKRWQNGILIPFNIRKNEAGATLNWQRNSRLNATCDLEWETGQINKATNFKNWRWQAKSAAQITSHLLISPSLDYLNYNLKDSRTKFLFGGMLFRYTIPKKKIDLELEGENLFNEKQFTWSSIDQGFIQIINYKLRTRSILLRFRLEF